MEQLAEVLGRLLLPDNAQRQEGERQLRELSRDPLLLPALMAFAQSSPSVEVRQLAALLLRRRAAGAGGLWGRLLPEVQAGIKSALLESIAKETSPLVRRACADAVSTIAKHAIPRGEWPELLLFLLQCCQSPEDGHREVAFVLFASLSETIFDSLQPHLPLLHSLFDSALRDPRPGGIRLAALRALEANVDEALLENLPFVQSLILPVLDAGRLAVGHGEEEAAGRVCELLIDLAESGTSIFPPPPSPLLPGVLHFCLELAGNQQLEPGVRFQAAQVLAWLAKGKAKALGKHRLVGQLAQAMLQLLQEPVGESDSEEDEAYDLSAQRFAAQVLDALAIHGPKKTLYSQVATFAKTHIMSSSYQVRFAATMGMAVITEGCCEQVGARLEADALPVLLRAFQDAHSKVKGAACFAVGQLTEFCEEAVLEHYKEVVSAVFAAADDPTKEVQTKAYYALAALCQELEEEQIVEFLDPLMHRLMGALNAALAVGAPPPGAAAAPGGGLREMCLSAIGSAAVAASGKFLPYCPAVLEVLVSLVGLSHDADLEVRARAYELVGIVGNAVGRATVEALIPGFMQAALQGFNLDHCELREYAHGMFADLAKLMGGDFAQYLPYVVPRALESLALNDGVIIPGKQAEEGGVAAVAKLLSAGAHNEEGDADDGDDDDEDELGGEGARFRVRTAVLDEKAAAAQALGAYARFVSPAFGPFFQGMLRGLSGGCRLWARGRETTSTGGPAVLGPGC